jgi:hypothetical protein
LSRELSRLGQQIRAVPEAITGRVAQRRLARTLEAGPPGIDGGVPQMSRIALYLIFQPTGVPQSTILTCRWLADQGLSARPVASRLPCLLDPASAALGTSAPRDEILREIRLAG